MPKTKILIIALVAVLVVGGGTTAFLLTRSDGMPDRGETFLAVGRTLSLPDGRNPVKEDLIQRGLVALGENGHIDVGVIEKFIDAGIYQINDEGYLTFGPTWTLTGEYPLEITRQDAEEIIGNPLPGIGYLPVNYSIHGLYLEEKTDQSAHFTIVITETDISDGDELDENNMDHKLLVYMNLYKQGQVGGLKLPGDRYTIGETKGVLWEQQATNELIWLFPYQVYPGQYEMSVTANKDMAINELLKIARSIGYG